MIDWNKWWKRKTETWVNIDENWFFTGRYHSAKIRYKNEFQIETISIDDKERKNLIETAYKNTPINIQQNNTNISTNLYEIIKNDIAKDNIKNMMAIGVFKLPKTNPNLKEKEKEEFIKKNKKLIMTLSVKNIFLDSVLEYFQNELDETEYQKLKSKFIYISKDDKEKRFFEFTRLANNFKCKTNEEKRINIFLIKEIIPMLISYIIFNLSSVFGFASNKRDLCFYSNSTDLHAKYYLRAFSKAIAIPPEQQILKNGLSTNIIFYKNITESDNIQKTIELLKQCQNKWEKTNSNPASQEDYYTIKEFKNEIIILNNNFIIGEISSEFPGKKNLDEFYFKQYPQNPISDYKNENNTNSITIALIKIDENNRYITLFTASFKKQNFFELQKKYLENSENFDKIHVNNFFSKLQTILNNKTLLEFTGFKSYDKFKEYNKNITILNFEKIFAFLLLKAQIKFNLKLEEMVIFTNLPENFSLYFKKHYKNYIMFSTDKNLNFLNTSFKSKYDDINKIKSNLMVFNPNPIGKIKEYYFEILNMYNNEKTDKNNNNKNFNEKEKKYA